MPLKPIVFRNKPLLLDGGMGRELRFRGVDVPSTIWSAGALITDPDVVRQIHIDYIAAGADVITTNTYGVIKNDLANVGIADRLPNSTRWPANWLSRRATCRNATS
jgi:S-methylmethionine-dependent homocysteine/selenocysteine methylase